MGPMGEGIPRDGREEIGLGRGEGRVRFGCLDPEEPRIIPGPLFVAAGSGFGDALGVGCAGGCLGRVRMGARPCVW